MMMRVDLLKPHHVDDRQPTEEGMVDRVDAECGDITLERLRGRAQSTERSGGRLRYRTGPEDLRGLAAREEPAPPEHRREQQLPE